MKIAVIGGTGKLGLALASRLHKNGHTVAVGSRDVPKAMAAAQSVGAGVIGVTNTEAAAWCEGAIVSVPYQGHHALLAPLKDSLSGKVLIDATVPIDLTNMLRIRTESGNSAAEETASIVPDAHVFAAFQTISHRVLRHAEASADVLVAGGPERKSDVMALVRSIELRAIDAGPLEVAGHIERLTVLLLSINKANKVKECSIAITGI